MKKTDAQRFKENVRIDKSTGCWLWGGYRDHRGYGRFYLSKKQQMVPAHRYLYEKANGPMPPGHETHHKCFFKNCVNPNHIQLLSHKDHMQLHAKLGVWGGEKNSQSRYTDLEVMSIKLLRRVFLIPARLIADKMDLPLRSIYYLSSNQGWNHLEPVLNQLVDKHVRKVG